MNKFQIFLNSVNKAFGRKLFDGTETEDEATAKIESIELPALDTDVINNAVAAAIQAREDVFSDRFTEIRQSITELQAQMNQNAPDNTAIESLQSELNKIATAVSVLPTAETIEGLRTELNTVKGDVEKLAKGEQGGAAEAGNTFVFPATTTQKPKAVTEYAKVDAGL